MPVNSGVTVPPACKVVKKSEVASTEKGAGTPIAPESNPRSTALAMSILAVKSGSVVRSTMRMTDPESAAIASSIRTLNEDWASLGPIGSAGSSQPPLSVTPIVLSSPERSSDPIATADSRIVSGPACTARADVLAWPPASYSATPSTPAFASTVAPDGSMRVPRTDKRSARSRAPFASLLTSTSCASTRASIVSPVAFAS